MALANPAPVAAFFGGLKVASAIFTLPAAIQSSVTGGGEVLTASLGTRLWRGTVTLAAMPVREGQEALALIEAMQDAGASFLATPLPRLLPALDPLGLLIAGHSPFIASVADNRRISIAGLPPHYELDRGGFLSFQYGPAPQRHALHRISEPVTANAAGITPLFDVRPHFRPGVSAGAQVQIAAPHYRAVIVPDTVNEGSSNQVVTSGISFQIIQTLSA
ncbi:hypothetical protein [Ketogulonicigenium vulgare]|uniref:hypothetical protein n=1 Tax=Ketogulonicigenium vulgare TaxID=92945 RepID=UPI002359AFC5|nr:hypothetical protein [Ketogulonicigenium vulgare]